jgi:hypothetical protein
LLTEISIVVNIDNAIDICKAQAVINQSIHINETSCETKLVIPFIDWEIGDHIKSGYSSRVAISKILPRDWNAEHVEAFGLEVRHLPWAIS